MGFRFGDITPKMGNQQKNNMEGDMETGLCVEVV